MQRLDSSAAWAGLLVLRSAETSACVQWGPLLTNSDCLQLLKRLRSTETGPQEVAQAQRAQLLVDPDTVPNCATTALLNHPLCYTAGVQEAAQAQRAQLLAEREQLATDHLALARMEAVQVGAERWVGVFHRPGLGWARISKVAARNPNVPNCTLLTIPFCCDRTPR